MSEQNLQVMPAELMRLATDTAGLCRDIVVKTAVDIQGRNYVKVEGWMAIATAHGCVAGATNVKQDERGTSATGEIRRISDGALICVAEGFVGADEPTWYGGVIDTRNGPKTMPKRPDYAIRAMAQTRAISRACRSAFAHVVVMMDAGLSTTPAEEVPFGGFDNSPAHAKPAERRVNEEKPPIQVPRDTPRPTAPAPAGGRWEDVVIHFGKDKDRRLGDMPAVKLEWWCLQWNPNEYPKGSGKYDPKDLALRAALDVCLNEQGGAMHAKDKPVTAHKGPTDKQLANVDDGPQQDVPY